MEKKYDISKTYQIGAGHSDCFEFCRPSSFLYFMQDISTMHSAINNMSCEILMQNGIFWMLVRIRFFLNRPILKLENLTVKTWHRSLKGALWYRDFEFKVNDEIVGGAYSSWITADFKTKKIVRPSLIKYSSDYLHPTLSSGPELLKIGEPDDAKLECRRLIRYSDLDMNRHLNNVKISDIVCDAIELHKNSSVYVSSMQINFIRETLPDEKLLIFTSGDDYKYVSGKGEDEVLRFESLTQLTRLG